MNELFEPRYIDGRQLWKKFDEAGFFVNREDRDIAQKAVEDMMVDGLEIVRCKDCAFYKQNPYSPYEDMMCMCWCDWLPTDPNDFCSYGERKE